MDRTSKHKAEMKRLSDEGISKTADDYRTDLMTRNDNFHAAMRGLGVAPGVNTDAGTHDPRPIGATVVPVGGSNMGWS